MSDKKTDLADVYRAAGATVTDDGAIMGPSMMNPQPFDIVLTVVPAGISMSAGRQPKIEFDVLLSDEIHLDGTMYEMIDHSFSIEIPVDQVRIFEKEK
jgi:hypothetical protein